MKYFKGYRKEGIIAPLFKMLEACFELFVPVVTARIIDHGIKDQDIHYIWGQCILLIFLGIVGLICSLTAQYYAAKTGMGFGANVRWALYHHINSFDYQKLDLAGTSTLVTRLTSDVNQLQSGVNMFLRLFMRSPIIVTGAVIMSFAISPKLATIFLIAMVLIGLATFLIIRFTIAAYKKVQGFLDAVVLHTRENYKGVRVVRAFAREKEEQEVFEDTSKSLSRMQIVAGRISGLLNPLTYTISNLGIVALLYFGGLEVNTGNLSQGEIVALTNYMTQISLALLVFANLVISVTKAIASATRVNEIFAIRPTMQEGEISVDKQEEKEEILRFDKVSFSYEKSPEQVLCAMNFHMNRGETLGIIGGTGQGKTTLVNLIPRFYEATEGNILINGRNIKDYTYESLRGMIGIAPQKSILFSGTIRDNMKWRKEDAGDEEIMEALKTAQALEIIETKESGLDTLVMAGGTNFSGGQRQRLCIARALVGNPLLLILDDSASALDLETDARLRLALKTSRKNKSTIVVSQRVATVKDADRILVLDEGHIAGIGTHHELLKNNEVYREICLSQYSREEVERYG